MTQPEGSQRQPLRAAVRGPGHQHVHGGQFGQDVVWERTDRCACACRKLSASSATLSSGPRAVLTPSRTIPTWSRGAEDKLASRHGCGAAARTPPRTSSQAIWTTSRGDVGTPLEDPMSSSRNRRSAIAAYRAQFPDASYTRALNAVRDGWRPPPLPPRAYPGELGTATPPADWKGYPARTPSRPRGRSPTPAPSRPRRPGWR